MGNMIKKIKEWFYSKRLKEKVRFLFLMLIVSYITIFFLIYSVFIRKNMIEYMMDNNYNSMVSIGNNLNIELGAISSMSKLIMTNKNVVDYLKSNKDKNSRLPQNAITSIYDISNTFNYISSVYIFRLDEDYIDIGREVTYVDKKIINSEKWREEIFEKAGSYVIKINGDGAFSTRTGTPIISFVRVINDMDTQKPIGLIVINLTTNILENTYKDMINNDKGFCYYDKDANILFGEKIEEFSYQVKIGDEKFKQVAIQGLINSKVLSYYNVPDTPFIIAKIENLYISKYISPQGIMIITIIIALTIVCLVIIGVFISVYIIKPIEKLVQYIDISNFGWSKKESTLLSDNPMKYLKKINDNKLVEINRLVEELLENEKAKQRAELEVLQEQIKPHFLYNTLGTIADLAIQNNDNEVYDAIETLGNFYRKFLSKGSKEITLRDEIAIVKNYLKLQNLRYEGVFEDIYDLQEELLDIRVPKLILQPLVENSLYHGIRPKGEKGIIKISVYKKDKKVHITVYDSGIGMDKEQISTMIKGNNKKSFGFKRTMDRIGYYYSIEDVFDIRSEEGVYCEVDIKIPI